MDFLLSFVRSLPGACGQGFAWGLMAIGVYLTYKILDVADLTVDGSLATGGAVCAVLISLGWNPWLALLMAVIAGMLAGLVTGLLHTACGIPAILAGILTQLALYSLNLRIMAIGDSAKTKATLALSVDRNPLLVSSRYVRELSTNNPLLLLAIIVAAVIALLYWFFGTELGCSIRATGANQSMSRAQGINTDKNKVLGLVVSNGLVALSGALLAQYSGSATIDMGRGAIVIGLAAVIIGEEGVPQLRAEAAVCRHWGHHLLHGHHAGAAHGPGVHRPEAAHRAGGGHLPDGPLLEGEVLHQGEKGGQGGCLS